jgi:hypothetical protein
LVPLHASWENAMQAIKAAPYQALEAMQRNPLVRPQTDKADAEAEKIAATKTADKAALQAADKPAAQAPRPTTNSQGETIGARLNVTA